MGYEILISMSVSSLWCTLLEAGLCYHLDDHSATAIVFRIASSGPKCSTSTLWPPSFGRCFWRTRPQQESLGFVTNPLWLASSMSWNFLDVQHSPLWLQICIKIQESFPESPTPMLSAVYIVYLKSGPAIKNEFASWFWGNICELLLVQTEPLPAILNLRRVVYERQVQILRRSQNVIVQQLYWLSRVRFVRRFFSCKTQF